MQDMYAVYSLVCWFILYILCQHMSTDGVPNLGWLILCYRHVSWSQGRQQLTWSGHHEPYAVVAYGPQAEADSMKVTGMDVVMPRVSVHGFTVGARLQKS